MPATSCNKVIKRSQHLELSQSCMTFLRRLERGLYNVQYMKGYVMMAETFHQRITKWFAVQDSVTDPCTRDAAKFSEKFIVLCAVRTIVF